MLLFTVKKKMKNISEIIAHRGLRLLYPENTLLSISSAIEKGYNVEFDIDLTKDSYLISIHQETLTVKNKKLILSSRDEARGWVQEYTFDELKDIDAGSWFDKKFSNLKIPTLNQILNLDWKNSQMFIEVKDPNFFSIRNKSHEEKLVSTLLHTLKKRINDKNCHIISFNPNILKLIRKNSKEAKLHLLIEPKGMNIFQNSLSKINSNQKQSFLTKLKTDIKIAREINAKSIWIPELVVEEKSNYISTIQKHSLLVGSYPLSPDSKEINISKKKQSLKLKLLKKKGVKYIVADL